MDIWETLGIGATDDIKQIKAAYAARAKERHPEEYPEEFKRLQQAYKSAVQYAKFQKEREQSQGVIVTLNTEKQKDIDDGQFNYEEVEQTDWQEWFFREFFCVAWNPYLMNNLICWEYILGRPAYRDLLFDAEFCRNFIMTVCALSGWKRDTILLFDSWVKSGGADGDRGVELYRWRRRKRRRFSGFALSVKRSVTREQKKMHDVLLARMVKSGGKDLSSEENIRCYLAFYLPYAMKNQTKIEKMYGENRQGGQALAALIVGGAAALLVMAAIYLFAPDKGEVQREKNIKAASEEIRRYNEKLKREDIIERTGEREPE